MWGDDFLLIDRSNNVKLVIMFESILVIILTLLLGSITLLHMYWFLGGEKGLDAALPTNYNHIKKQFSYITLRLVNAILLAPVIGVLIILIISLYDLIFLISLYKHDIYFWFGIIFIFRAVIGWLVFHKIIKKELFIQKNRTIYSPVSMFIGLLFLALLQLQ